MAKNIELNGYRIIASRKVKRLLSDNAYSTVYTAVLGHRRTADGINEYVAAVISAPIEIATDWISGNYTTDLPGAVERFNVLSGLTRSGK